MVKVYEKHSMWLRISHWINVPLLSLMIWSGILIYWANSVYPFFFPEWFYDALNINGRLAEGLSIHFMVGWFFVLNGLVYVLCFFRSGHWREVLPNATSLRWMWPTLLHDLGLWAGKPLPSDKFNAVQRLAYSSVIVLAAIEVLSGFAIYKPVQLSWLTSCFGGYEGARLVHFIIMISFCLFLVVHLIQVFRAGWNNFRAMVAGFELEEEGHHHVED